MIRRENWLLLQKYLATLRSKPGTEEKSIERYEFAINHLLRWADEQAFIEALEEEGALSFLRYVSQLPARRGEGGLAWESQKKIVVMSRAFLSWAKSRNLDGMGQIDPDELDLLAPGDEPRTDEIPVHVSLDEVLHLTSLDPSGNVPLWMGQQAMALAYLSGARKGALATATLQSIDLGTLNAYKHPVFMQYAKFGVNTKNDVQATTFLLPIDSLIEGLRKWVTFIAGVKNPYGLLFPPLLSKWGDFEISPEAPGEHRASAFNDLFKAVYQAAGIGEAYKSPHKFRHGHAVYALERCETMAQYHAISRNLMHASIQTTDRVYSVLGLEERRRVIASLTPARGGVPDDELERYIRELAPGDRKRAMHLLVEMTLN